MICKRLQNSWRRRERSCVCETSKWNVERESRTFDSILRFPWLGELGTLILFVHIHWDSGRFMLMNAPDSTIWPLQGNSGSTMEAQFTHLASRTTFAIRKRKIRMKEVIFTKQDSTLATFVALRLTLGIGFITWIYYASSSFSTSSNTVFTLICNWFSNTWHTDFEVSGKDICLLLLN